MSNLPNPKKPRRPKSKRLKLNRREEWTKILRDVEKKEIPVHFLNALTVNLKDGTAVDVNIVQLMNEGIPPDVIEQHLNKRLKELDAYIVDVDFHISLENVSKVVQTLTDNLLKDL